ncbi:MAG TPA: FtsX-like permease family protein, partial [Vicinamibacteria bacterium]|nr:FtsX-like permease family protein [Vicinamibacteria bacterium]
MVLAIGFGAFLLGTLLLVQFNLLRQLRLTGGPQRPNLVLFDIQRDQLPTVERALADAGLPSTGPVPIVPMRITSIKGRPVTRMLGDTTAPGDGPPGGWALRREYRSTYRDTLVSSERLVAGEWWEAAAQRQLRPSAVAMRDRARPSAPSQISVETELAGELRVGVGDEIVWDVQGLPITTRIASLREVEWARFEPNFFVVFPEGPLAAAPQTFVSLLRLDDGPARAQLTRRLVEAFPNVTAVDLTELQQAVEAVVDRVAFVVRFLALFSLGTGGLVLLGAVASSRYQRMREGVLLKALGATRAQLLRINLVEHALLG